MLTMKWVEIKDVSKHTIIPEEVISKGKYSAPSLTNSLDVDEMIKHAQVLSANEPNKSDPIPAISPTLSPTLSAITPGF